MKSYWLPSLFIAFFTVLSLVTEAPAQEFSEQFHMTGPNKTVTAMTIWQGDLVVGGLFNAVGPVPANKAARLVGSQWEDMGTGLNIH